MKDVDTITELKKDMTRYCAYQERCRFDIEQKLKVNQLNCEQTEDILQFLALHKFWDEMRYAQMYAQGKFRINQWGKMKIRNALQLKKVEHKIIDQALTSIDLIEYQNTIIELINKKNKLIQEKDSFKRNHKLIQYLLQKGFEYEIVINVLNTDQTNK